MFVPIIKHKNPLIFHIYLITESFGETSTSYYYTNLKLMIHEIDVMIKAKEETIITNELINLHSYNESQQ